MQLNKLITLAVWDAQVFMRSSGKIYVVAAVLLLIIIGLFIYLYFIDRRLKNLETEIKDVTDTEFSSER